MNEKKTTVYLESEHSANLVVLNVFSDLIRTEVGKELYVGQTGYIVTKILELNSETLRIHVRPKD